MSPGYGSSLYAESLSEFGMPLHLPSSDGWLLERPIPNCAARDAMGCYPLFACSNWAELREDLEDLRGRLVSVTLVNDPFAPLSAGELSHAFDQVVPFKRHFVVDLSIGVPVTSKHHRYYARRGLKHVRVTRSIQPRPAELAAWLQLYAKLVQRHQLHGIQAFSHRSFELQFQVPGLVLLQAWHESQLVGAHLWFVQGDVAYSHLMALDLVGYSLNAAYALYWEAIHQASAFFSPQVRWLSLGAGAGAGGDSDAGLTWFKRGWSSATRQVYLCGKILDAQRYADLTSTTGTAGAAYFPAYRSGEFV